jgi:hypothetical protein
VRLVVTEQTRSVVRNCLWNLTRCDLTLRCHWNIASGHSVLALARACGVCAPARPVSTNAASDHYLAAGAERFDRWNHADDIEPGGHMDGDPRSDAGGPASV